MAAAFAVTSCSNDEPKSDGDTPPGTYTPANPRTELFQEWGAVPYGSMGGVSDDVSGLAAAEEGLSASGAFGSTSSGLSQEEFLLTATLLDEEGNALTGDDAFVLTGVIDANWNVTFEAPTEHQGEPVPTDPDSGAALAKAGNYVISVGTADPLSSLGFATETVLTVGGEEPPRFFLPRISQFKMSTKVDACAPKVSADALGNGVNASGKFVLGTHTGLVLGDLRNPDTAKILYDENLFKGKAALVDLSPGADLALVVDSTGIILYDLFTLFEDPTVTEIDCEAGACTTKQLIDLDKQPLFPVRPEWCLATQDLRSNSADSGSEEDGVFESTASNTGGFGNDYDVVWTFDENASSDEGGWIATGWSVLVQISDWSADVTIREKDGVKKPFIDRITATGGRYLGYYEQTTESTVEGEPPTTCQRYIFSKASTDDFQIRITDEDFITQERFSLKTTTADGAAINESIVELNNGLIHNEQFLISLGVLDATSDRVRGTILALEPCRTEQTAAAENAGWNVAVASFLTTDNHFGVEDDRLSDDFINSGAIDIDDDVIVIGSTFLAQTADGVALTALNTASGINFSLNADTNESIAVDASARTFFTYASEVPRAGLGFAHVRDDGSILDFSMRLGLASARYVELVPGMGTIIGLSGSGNIYWVFHQVPAGFDAQDAKSHHTLGNAIFELKHPDCSSEEPCPDNGVCLYQDDLDSEGRCLPQDPNSEATRFCGGVTRTECSAGMVCDLIDDDLVAGTCILDRQCSSDDPCAPGYICVTDSGDYQDHRCPDGCAVNLNGSLRQDEMCCRGDGNQILCEYIYADREPEYYDLQQLEERFSSLGVDPAAHCGGGPDDHNGGPDDHNGGTTGGEHRPEDDHNGGGNDGFPTEEEKRADEMFSGGNPPINNPPNNNPPNDDGTGGFNDGMGRIPMNPMNPLNPPNGDGTDDFGNGNGGFQPAAPMGLVVGGANPFGQEATDGGETYQQGVCIAREATWCGGITAGDDICALPEGAASDAVAPECVAITSEDYGDRKVCTVGLGELCIVNEQCQADENGRTRVCNGTCKDSCVSKQECIDNRLVAGDTAEKAGAYECVSNQRGARGFCELPSSRLAQCEADEIRLNWDGTSVCSDERPCEAGCAIEGLADGFDAVCPQDFRPSDALFASCSVGCADTAECSGWALASGATSEFECVGTANGYRFCLEATEGVRCDDGQFFSFAAGRCLSGSGAVCSHFNKTCMDKDGPVTGLTCDPDVGTCFRSCDAEAGAETECESNEMCVDKPWLDRGRCVANSELPNCPEGQVTLTLGTTEVTGEYFVSESAGGPAACFLSRDDVSCNPWPPCPPNASCDNLPTGCPDGHQCRVLRDDWDHHNRREIKEYACACASAECLYCDQPSDCTTFPGTTCNTETNRCEWVTCEGGTCDFVDGVGQPECVQKTTPDQLDGWQAQTIYPDDPICIQPGTTPDGGRCLTNGACESLACWNDPFDGDPAGECRPSCSASDPCEDENQICEYRQDQDNLTCVDSHVSWCGQCQAGEICVDGQCSLTPDRCWDGVCAGSKACIRYSPDDWNHYDNMCLKTCVSSEFCGANEVCQAVETVQPHNNNGPQAPEDQMAKVCVPFELSKCAGGENTRDACDLCQSDKDEFDVWSNDFACVSDESCLPAEFDPEVHQDPERTYVECVEGNTCVGKLRPGDDFVRGRCVEPPCSTDNPCGAGEVCEIGDHTRWIAQCVNETESSCWEECTGADKSCVNGWCTGSQCKSGVVGCPEGRSCAWDQWQGQGLHNRVTNMWYQEGLEMCFQNNEIGGAGCNCAEGMVCLDRWNGICGVPDCDTDEDCPTGLSCGRMPDNHERRACLCPKGDDSDCRESCQGDHAKCGGGLCVLDGGEFRCEAVTCEIGDDTCSAAGLECVATRFKPDPSHGALFYGQGCGEAGEGAEGDLCQNGSDCANGFCFVTDHWQEDAWGVCASDDWIGCSETEECQQCWSNQDCVESDNARAGCAAGICTQTEGSNYDMVCYEGLCLDRWGGHPRLEDQDCDPQAAQNNWGPQDLCDTGLECVPVRDGFNVRTLCQPTGDVASLR